MDISEKLNKDDILKQMPLGEVFSPKKTTWQIHEIFLHIYFITFWSTLSTFLEIEATVYKTFPAEIIDGPASAFKLSQTAWVSIYIKRKKNWIFKKKK